MKQQENSTFIHRLLSDETRGEAHSNQPGTCLDMINAFIALLDRDGRVKLMNEKGRGQLGFDRELPADLNMLHLCKNKEQQSRFSTVLEHIIKDPERGHDDFELFLYSRSGDLRIYHMGIWPVLKDGPSILGFVLSGTDVTGYKQSASDLKASMEEAENMNQIKSEFLARVSHEIRTPLNAVMGFTEQLMQTDLSPKQEEFLKVIDKSSEHLLSLINDVLVLSKIEAQEINFETQPFKLVYSVEMVFASLRSKAEEKGLEFSYNIDEKLDNILLGDAFRLRQILLNMLSNAIKFTKKGSVRLHCYQQAETEEKVQVGFEVTDTGIGIDPDKLEKVFQQFRQADSSITKQFGGTGLGLTICKKLIELQHGSLSVASEPGQGSTFKFQLPYKKGTAADIIPEDLGSTDSQKLRGKEVLLVDDDSVNRLLGKTLLDKFRCQYDIASSGEEAIAKLQSHSFDIVLLDLHMPDLDGFEVAKFVRDDNHDQKTKIIAVTAAVMQTDIQHFPEVGIDDFLVKPFKETHLFNRMCDVLSIETQTGGRETEQIILRTYEEDKSYDLAELKNMADGDVEFANQMLRTFIENSQQSIHIFNSLLEQEDWRQIGETAHKIIPSYRHLSVEAVVSKLIEIKDKSLIHKDYEQIPDLLRATIGEMENLISDLEAEIT